MRSNGIPEHYLQEMLDTYKTLTAEAFAHVIVETKNSACPLGSKKWPRNAGGGWPKRI